MRNLLRTLSLLGAALLLAYGMLSGAVTASPTDPPNDSVWLLCLGVAFPLLLLYTWLTVAGVVFTAVGWGLGELGVCPVVKRIWTPSWVLFSGGLCFLFLAGFWVGRQRWDKATDHEGKPNLHAFQPRIDRSVLDHP